MILTTTRKILTAIVACLLSCSAHAAPVLWPSSSGGNDHYYDFIAGNFYWPDAHSAAQLITPPVGYQNGHLLTITNLAEEQFVLSHWPSNEGWFGFTDSATEGEWKWIDSTPGIWQDPDNFVMPLQSAYSNWEPNEPNDNGGNEDYGIFNYVGAGKWNDGVGTSGSQYGYFVEFVPVPEPSAMIALLATVTFVGIGVHRRSVSVSRTL